MPLILPFMIRQGEQAHITEPYVSVPPALTITDEVGAIWTLGFRYGAAPRGEFAFNVLRNGLETGEVASRIELRRGRIRVFTATGWKYMSTSPVDDRTTVRGFGARLKSEPANHGRVTVTVYREATPMLSFVFESRLGGGVEPVPSYLSLVMEAGKWLSATVSPQEYAPLVTVMAQVGPATLREVPVVSGAQAGVEEVVG